MGPRRYDEFCLAELKRKYRWKAYARRDEEVLTGFLKLAFYRVAGQLFVLPSRLGQGHDENERCSPLNDHVQ